MMLEKQKMSALRTELMRVKDASTGPKIRQCEERFTQLVGDIFIGKLTRPSKYTIKRCLAWETFIIYVDFKIIEMTWSLIISLTKGTRWFRTWSRLHRNIPWSWHTGRCELSPGWEWRPRLQSSSRWLNGEISDLSSDVSLTDCF